MISLVVMRGRGQQNVFSGHVQRRNPKQSIQQRKENGNCWKDHAEGKDLHAVDSGSLWQRRESIGNDGYRHGTTELPRPVG